MSHVSRFFSELSLFLLIIDIEDSRSFNLFDSRSEFQSTDTYDSPVHGHLRLPSLTLLRFCPKCSNLHLFLGS